MVGLKVCQKCHLQFLQFHVYSTYALLILHLERGILKSLVSHVLNFKSWIKFIYDQIIYIYCVINEFNPTFKVQKMGNRAFQNVSFGNASFPNGNEGNSCPWASLLLTLLYPFFLTQDYPRYFLFLNKCHMQ